MAEIPIVEREQTPPNRTGVYLIANDTYGYVGSAFKIPLSTSTMNLDRGLRIRFAQHRRIIGMGAKNLAKKGRRDKFKQVIHAHYMFAKSKKKPAYRVLSMYPSVLESHPRSRIRKLGLLDENTKIMLFGTLRSNVGWHAYMVANSASSDFADTLRQSLDIANPPWSIGANIALPQRAKYVPLS